MFRGNELRDIFIDDKDKQLFLQTLNEKAKEECFAIYAYCLMDNHVHILLAGEHSDLGNLVKRINTRYVYYFNKKYERIGHLFHDRYKSEPVEGENHLLEVVRYIHYNPVKAGKCVKPSDYKWSSYRYYTSNVSENHNNIDVSFVLNMFSNDLMKARQQFIDFSKKTTSATFTDIPEDIRNEEYKIKGTQEATKYIAKYLKSKDLTLDCIGLKGYEDARHELIVELRTNSNLSIREIASLLKINRGMVQRAKV
jgi:REP element-mobilizing transposase RayT/DNA-binding transcriptional regulator YiaG